MRITIHAIAMDEEADDFSIGTEVADKTTIANVLDEFKTLYAFGRVTLDIAHYYEVRDIYFSSWNAPLPYVIKNDVVYWQVELSQVTAIDFLTTHERLGTSLRIRYYLPKGTGGGGAQILLDLDLSWDQVWLYLSYASSVWQLMGFPSARDAFIWVKLYFVKRRARPAAVFSLVTSRNRWNPIELAEYIQSDRDYAKLLLELCGYKWDAHEMMYKMTADTETLVDNLQSIDYVDHEASRGLG